MNPFKEKPMPVEKALQNWKELYPKSWIRTPKPVLF